MPNEQKTPFYSWFVLLLAASFLFYKYVLQVSPGIISTDLLHEFNINATQLGNLAAVYFYSYMIVQLFAGPLLDRFSAQKVASLAILLCAIGACIFSQTHILLTAFLARILIGIGVAFATVSYMKIASLYFRPNQFAFVGGLLATAAMTGAMFGETPLVLILEKTGWREMLFGVSMTGILLAFLFFMCVKPQKVILQKKQLFQWASLKKIFCTKQNWLIMLYSGFAFSPLAVLGGLWGNPFLQTVHHLTLRNASFLLSFMFLGLAIGSPVIGLVSDKLNKRKPIMMISAFFAFISLALAIYLPNNSAFILGALLFLFGFFTGAFMLGFALAKETNPVFMAGSVIAMINTGGELLSGITEPLVGKILDLYGNVFTVESFHVALGILPIYVLAAFLLLFMVK